MKNNKLKIVGAGGGKSGGSGGTPREAENTLQSRSTAKLVHVLSEGEIQGIVGAPSEPLQSVYFDQTPVTDSDGNASFNGVSIDYRNGLSSQEPLVGFTEQEDFNVVSIEVEDDGPVTQSVDANSDAARVIVRLPNGLTRLDEETGDLNGYVVGVAVDTRLGTSGAWTEVFSKFISGKTTSSYEEAYRIERPSGSGVWQVRVRRTTETSESTRINDRIDFWAYVDLLDMQVPYNDAAVVGLSIDSESTGGRIPTQSFLIDGIKLKVPNVYTPTSYNTDGSVDSYASYSAVWDGATFKDAFCDDPAWICYNLLLNDRWGLGLNQNELDQYSFYEASLYNMELIEAFVDSPDDEPRFTFNGNIATREDPYKVIQAVAATCRGVVYANPGLIRFIQDRPQDPSHTINNTNVEDGKFSYSSTPRENRITSVNVTFNDITDRYLPKVINEQATAAQLERFGYNELQIGAMGVVKETQARRLAKWALDSALTVNQIVSFTVGWKNAFLDVGDVFNVLDNDYTNIQSSGKVANISTNGFVVTLDRPYTFAGGERIRLVTPTGLEIERFVNTGFTVIGTPTTLVAVSPTAFDLDDFGENTEYYITGSVAPRQFKVISVSEQDATGILSIEAVTYDPLKYDRVEQGIVLPDPGIGIGGSTIATPQNLSFDVESILTPDSTIRFRLRVNWNEVIDPYLSHYILRYRRNVGQYSMSDDLTQGQFIIDDALPGYYEVLVSAVNTRGVMSTPAEGSIELDIGGQDSPIEAVSNLELIDGGTTFNAGQFTAVWDAPTQLGGTVLKDYVVRLLDDNDNVMKIYIADTETQTITRDEVIIASGLDTAIRDVNVSVTSRDVLNRVSPDEVETTFTNPAPAAVTITNIESLIGSYKVEHTESTEADHEGYVIVHSTTSGFTPSRNNRVKEDIGLSHIVEADQDETYYVRVAGYDTWSRKVDELNFSAQSSVLTQFLLPPPPDPDDPIGLVAASNISTLLNGTQVANIVLTWNVVTGDDIVYDLEIREAGVLYNTSVVSNPRTGSIVSFQFNGDIGVEYCFRVRARRGGTVVSNWTVAECVTQAEDTTATNTPTSISVTALYQGALVQWTNPTNANFSHIEVWRRLNNGSGNGEKVADVSKPVRIFFDDGLTIGTAYRYRVRGITQAGVASNFSAWATVTPLNVPSNSITANAIAANSVTANAIAANSITANAIGANQIIVNSANIGNAVITSAMFQDTIQSDNFVAGASGWRIRRNTGAAEFGEIIARGSIATGTGTQQRTEILSNDATYIMWIGSGVRNDANGIMWIKTNGDSYINRQVFNVGGGISGNRGTGVSGTASQGSNTLSASTSVTPNGEVVKIDSSFSFRASYTKTSGGGVCPLNQRVTGTMRLQRSPNGSSGWVTVDSKTLTSDGSCVFTSDPDPSIPDQSFVSNGFDETKSFLDANPLNGVNYYRINFSEWTSHFLSSQVSLNVMDIIAVG